ncbi:cell wall-active antibiotics response protein LiaF [Enterococcus sp. LJL98]
MNKSWRFFIIVESLFLLLALWQLVNHFLIIIMLGIGALLIFVSQNNQRENHPKNVKLMLGLTIVFFSLLNIPAIWFMLVFGVLFIGLKGLELSGLSLSKSPFQLKKKMLIVETKEANPKSGRVRKQQLFGNERLGSQIYEWDDLNLMIASGDTIIDLGNTILPKKENFIVIRKGFGRTRILVPSGVGIHLDCSVFAGTVIFDEDRMELRNEQLTLYSTDYDESSRRVKIISNTLIGDVEVIQI